MLLGHSQTVFLYSIMPFEIFCAALMAGAMCSAHTYNVRGLHERQEK